MPDVRFPALGAAALLTMTAVAAAAQEPRGGEAAAGPTFARDVAPIVFEHCLA